MTASLGYPGLRLSLVIIRRLSLMAAITAGSSCVSAQQVAVSTPVQIVNDRFSGGGGMRLFAEQGSRRSFTSQTPTIVVPNGGTGAIFSGSLRPFVVGVVPVVGDGFGYAPITVWPQGLPWAVSPIHSAPGPSLLQQRLAENWEAIASATRGKPSLPTPVEADAAGDVRAPMSVQSTAQRGDLSVNEILRHRAAMAAHDDAEVRQLVERGRIAEAEGKRAAARVFYEMAARRASVAERAEIIQQLRRLSRSSSDEVRQD